MVLVLGFGMVLCLGLGGVTARGAFRRDGRRAMGLAFGSLVVSNTNFGLSHGMSTYG